MSIVPAGASAAGGSDSGSGSSAAFTIHGSHGFALDVKSEHGTVTMVVSDRRPPVATFSESGSLRPANPGDVASNIYYAFGASHDSNRVDARLGKLGRIDVVFHPSGRVHVTKLNSEERTGTCASPATIVRHLGRFTGTIDFHGEHGYTAVDAGSARGSVGTPLFPGCSSGPGGQGAAGQASSVNGDAILSALDHRDGTKFEAVTTEAGVVFNAFSVEQLGFGMIVSRSAHAISPPASFAFDSSLGSARVEPPAPFSGAAAFNRSASRGAPAWSGDLSIAFPGALTSLAGPEFGATLGSGY